MTTQEYQKKVHSFAVYGNNQMYPLLGLCEESGEVQGKVAKFIRKHDGKVPLTASSAVQDVMDDWNADNAKLHEELQFELGDCLWMIAEICNVYGFDMEKVMDRNIAKLEDRKNRNVIVGSGDHR